MIRRPAVVAMLLAACSGASETPGDGGDEPQDDSSDIPGPGPCTLPPLAQTVATLAGCAEPGTADGARTMARFNNPTNVVISPTGITYVTDFDSNRLRAIDTSGTTTTIYQATHFRRPFGIALAPGNKLYVQTDDNDLGSHSTETGTLWLVDPATKQAEVIARDLGRPRGLVPLADGRIAMSDYMHHVITIFDPTTKTETLLAGGLDEPGHANGVGAAARFAQPYDIVQVADGALVVADYDNHRLRRVQLDGTVTDFAGSGEIGVLNGPVGVATFDAPQGLALLPTGVLFVTDVKRKVIRKIENGIVSTVAGDGTSGWLDADEPRGARFYGLEGIDVDAARLVVADGNVGDDMPFHHVRVVLLSGL